MKRKNGGAGIFVGIAARVKRFFQKLFSGSSETACAGKAEPPQVDWSVKDVMVGTVRTEEQLHFNILNCGYYAPARFVPDECLPIKYIALHEEELIDEPGIKRCGEVLSVRKIRRGKIPVAMRPKADPNEIYYYFTVREWRELPQPIAIQDTFRGKPQFTNRFLLENCRKSYQLFTVSSEEEYRLMTEIDRVIGNPEADLTEENTAVYRVNDERVVAVTDGFFTVADENGEIIDRVAVSEYEKHPRAGFMRIKKAIDGKDEAK